MDERPMMTRGSSTRILSWSPWFDPRVMRPPWGMQAEWELTTRTGVMVGRTVHLCQMSDEGRHEVVFFSAEPPRRVYFVEEVLRWRIMCAPDLFG